MFKAFFDLINRIAGLFSQRLDVHVDGVEITQAIQYYHSRLHLSDPSQQGRDNTVRLVTGKAAFVRVYLRAGQRSFGAATATLEVRRRSIHGIYHKVALLTALPPGEIIAQSNPPYALERAIEGSINFFVPAEMMTGSMSFHVSASEGTALAKPLPIRDTYDVYADVHLQQTLRLRSIMIGYAGPKSSNDTSALFINPPSFPADLLNTAAATLEMFPVQSTPDLTSAGFVTCELPLDDGAGCSPHWDQLFAKLLAQKTADGNRSDVIYYGLLPKDVPFRDAHNRVGCERMGFSVGRVTGNDKSNFYTDGGAVMAHLIGHECGLLHAPGHPDTASVDPNFPAYTPYDPIGIPKGSIGEYGMASFGKNGLLFLPQNIHDFMRSIYSSNWISLYHYGRLIENPRLHPVIISEAITATRIAVMIRDDQDVQPKPMISVIGILQSESVFEPTSIMRIATRPLTIKAPTRGFVIELRDEFGAAIAKSPLRMLSSWGSGGECGCKHEASLPTQFPCVVQAQIPDIERGVLLAISNAAQDIWSYARRARSPQISDFDASVNGNFLVVNWKVETECKKPEIWLQWSANEGGIWNALGTGLSNEGGTFDVCGVTQGQVVLRLLASDGFDTAISPNVCVEIAQRPITIAAEGATQ